MCFDKLEKSIEIDINETLVCKVCSDKMFKLKNNI